MGERFGFYTMVSIFVLFLQAKYGFTAAQSSFTYSTFMFCVYFFPLIGGILADKVFGYGKTIGIGLVVMFLGYALLAIPTAMGTGFPLIIAALAVIAIGTGFFKGNLQALVGNLYDDPKYSALRDRAFNIFYMGINIGAMFAPTASEAVSNWILKGGQFHLRRPHPRPGQRISQGQARRRRLLPGHRPGPGLRRDARHAQGVFREIHQRPEQILSFRVRRRLHQPDHLDAHLLGLPEILQTRRPHRKTKSEVRSPQSPSRRAHARSRRKERFIALGLVFLVVIFFWMAFHQSAVTMTYFARDYTVPSVGKADESVVRPDRAPPDLPGRSSGWSFS